MFDFKVIREKLLPDSSLWIRTREKECLIPLYVLDEGSSQRASLLRTPIPILNESACTIQPGVLVVHLYDSYIEARSAAMALESMSRIPTEISTTMTGEHVLLTSYPFEDFARIASDNTLREMRNLLTPNEHLMVVLLDLRRGEHLSEVTFSDQYTHQYLVRYLHALPLIEGIGSIRRVSNLTELIAKDLETDTAVRTMQGKLLAFPGADVTLAAISTGNILDCIDDLIEDGTLLEPSEEGLPAIGIVRSEIDRAMTLPQMVKMSDDLHHAVMNAVIESLCENGILKG